MELRKRAQDKMGACSDIKKISAKVLNGVTPRQGAPTLDQFTQPNRPFSKVGAPIEPQFWRIYRLHRAAVFAWCRDKELLVMAAPFCLFSVPRAING
jgi:hypothetical protein